MKYFDSIKMHGTTVKKGESCLTVNEIHSNSSRTAFQISVLRPNYKEDAFRYTEPYSTQSNVPFLFCGTCNIFRGEVFSAVLNIFHFLDCC